MGNDSNENRMDVVTLENRFHFIITLPERLSIAPETLRLEDESVRQTQEFVTARIFAP